MIKLQNTTQLAGNDNKANNTVILFDFYIPDSICVLLLEALFNYRSVEKNVNCNRPNFHNTGLSAGELIAIIHSHGGAYYSHWVKRKARGCFLLVKRETERLLVVTLNLLNYVFIKGRRQKQAISQWRGLSHQEFLNEAY